jgi:branched-chain amino acid aminotransferase
MNVFFLVEPEGGGVPTLVTPSLEDGTILPGVTRQSVLELARSREWQLGGTDSAPRALCVEERPIALWELRELASSGRLLECFGTGTAVVCQPVEVVAFRRDPAVDGAQAAVDRYECRHRYDGSSLAEQMLVTIQGIQYGREVDHPWSVPVCPLASE